MCSSYLYLLPLFIREQDLLYPLRKICSSRRQYKTNLDAPLYATRANSALVKINVQDVKRLG